MSADQKAARITARQQGLIHRRQALGCGFTPAAIRHRLESGRWIQMLPGVYLIAGVPSGALVRHKAATLWAGELRATPTDAGAACSHHTAAVALGLKGILTPRIHISTTGSRRSPASDLQVHHVQRLRQSAVTIVDGIPITDATRTLIDLAGSGLHRHRLQMALDSALRRKLATAHTLSKVLEEPKLRGRRGVSILRAMVPDREQAEDTETFGQMVVRDLLVDFGLPPAIMEYVYALATGATARIDLAYPWIRYGIEVDGYDPHCERPTFDWDRYRDSLLQAEGWTICRVSVAKVERRPREAIAPLVRVYHELTRRAAGGVG